MLQEVEVNDGVDAVVDDRISALPGVVLQHILTFIPTKQVAQSTLLSKSWKQVWNTFPILIFDQNYFESNWVVQKARESVTYAILWTTLYKVTEGREYA